MTHELLSLLEKEWCFCEKERAFIPLSFGNVETGAKLECGMMKGLPIRIFIVKIRQKGC